MNNFKELINEKLKETKQNLQDTYCDCICNYSDGYICDIIMEIADNNVDIYNSDLLDWAKDNYSYIEDANCEFGIPDNGKDFIKQIQQGQYYQIEQDLYNNFDEMILLFIYNYIQENDIEMTEEQLEELELKRFDNNDRLENIIYEIEEISKSEVEE